MIQATRVAIIGCGNISDIYFQNLAKFQTVQVVACADLDVARAQATASKYGIPWAGSAEEILNDAEVDLILNLTTPDAHASVALGALKAGKHVYNEKPLALELKDATAMLELANAQNLRVGGAPDTFLGGGLQTCRQLIDDGAIGTPLAASAFMTCPGHESWHPNPGFYYQPGAGPMFDMGPYYLTALVSLLGSVRRVTGQARASFPTRTITSQPKFGERIMVNTPTHVTGLLEFENGVQGTVITSFDVWAANLPFIEIYGSEGSLSLPDPNTFGGTVKLFQKDEKIWKDMPITRSFTENSRGLGVADMAQGIQKNLPHRANGELALHVLEIMHGFLTSSTLGQHIAINSRCVQPAPLNETIMIGAS